MLDGGQRKLYDLIARRFLATLMGPATIENTKVHRCCRRALRRKRRRAGRGGVPRGVPVLWPQAR